MACRKQLLKQPGSTRVVISAIINSNTEYIPRTISGIYHDGSALAEKKEKKNEI